MIVGPHEARPGRSDGADGRGFDFLPEGRSGECYEEEANQCDECEAV